MRIKEGFDLNRLKEYGFTYVNEKLYDADKTNGIGDKLYGYFDEEFENAWVGLLGYGRRGQAYYLLIRPGDIEVYIYATDADGSGCSTPLDDLILRLIKDGVLE